MFALVIFCVNRNNPSKFRDSCLARAATAAESLRDLMNRLPLSISIISFNEEQNLRRCLASVADLAAEVVIVDSGSTDRTAEIAAEFGVEPPPQVQRIAMSSKRNIKRINNPDDVMSLPYSIVATRQRFNIYAGNY